VLHNLKRYEAALDSYEQALRLRPNSVEALTSRGATLREIKRHHDALDTIDQVLAIEPGHSLAHCYRGIALGDLKRYEDALASFDRSLALQPDLVEAYEHRGNILRWLRRYNEALTSYGQGLATNPEHLTILNNRANLLVYMARADEAAADYSRLVALAPDYAFAQGHLMQTLRACCDWRNLNALSSVINEGVRQGKKSIEPFLFLGVSTSPDLLQRCARIYSEEKFPPATRKLFSGKPRHNDKIRLGYVAGEFRHHATSILVAELFEKHDTSRFELFAFDNGWDDGSDIRKRLENAFTTIVDISRLSDLDAATRINTMEMDILIDLNGHVGLKRTGIFSYRPAPIQVNWLGFPGTMGVDYMDYIIGDTIVIPAGHEAYYSEKVVRLPDTYQVNDSKRVIAGRAPTRAEAKLPDSGFVFCCFNNNYKITPEVFDIWMHLLRRVERSVLWLLEDNPAASRNLRTEASARGVAPERLVFAPRLTLPDHLARHRLADLFLDTLPYNAHTTASDALWAGLPLLTCMGTTFAGRVSGSLLHAVGLPELVTESLADYESLALKLAATPALLADMRTRLASNRSTCPLFDTDRFTRQIESAYVTMHDRWLRGETPASFTAGSVD
jgi:predicted O-linked N-acetylglucosamine transferase (SPINDLY family)